MATPSPLLLPPPPSSSSSSSPPPPLPWRLPLLLLLLLPLFLPSSSSSTSIPAFYSSYSSHCDRFDPKATPPTTRLPSSAAAFYLSSGHFSGGGDGGGAPPFFPKPGTFRFRSRQIYQTTDPTILQLAGTLTLIGPYPPLAVRRNSSGLVRPLRAMFPLAGLWSEASGALCMVGNGVLRPLPHGAPDYLPAVLKLGYPKSSNISTSIITGTLETLSPAGESNHFDPISLVAYTQNMYNYTLLRKANESCTIRRRSKEEEPLVLDRDSLCSTLRSFLSYGSFKLSYKNFSFMSPILSNCSDDDDRFRVFAEFSDSDIYNYSRTTALVPGKSMVGEGFWDRTTNRLCLLACPVLSDASVGDCYVGLSFWFPSYLSVKTRSLVLGRMWSNKEEGDESYFEPIMLKSAGDHLWHITPNLKYKYTKLDKVTKYYFKSNDASVVAGKKRYPDGRISDDMRFSFSFQDPKDGGGWGNAYLFLLGDTDFGDRTIYLNGESPVGNPTHAETNRTLLSVTYTVSIQFWNSTGESRNLVESRISAEGLYSSSTGQLYLIGCGNPGLSGTESMDCEIFINMQLSPLNSERNEKANGTITSTRDKSDTLYFAPLKIASNIMYAVEAQGAIQRMEIEVAMVVISLTLYCIFTCLQLYHAKKNRDIIPSISTTMLLILTLGSMIPLILNFEALFFANRNRRSIYFHSGHWIEAGEVVALVLQLRLLEVAWTARSSSDGQKKSSWATEGRTLLACLPLYIIGAVIAWFVRSAQQPLWEDLIAYAGLILDGFLLPQIIFSLFSNSNNKALTPFFYVGITVVRSMPHLYDAFRARHYFPQLESSYVYAKPEEDFYSTLWDIIVPCEGLLFAALVYLQQRFGGRCFVPMRFREGAGYERVAAVSSQ